MNKICLPHGFLVLKIIYSILCLRHIRDEENNKHNIGFV